MRVAYSKMFSKLSIRFSPSLLRRYFGQSQIVNYYSTKDNSTQTDVEKLLKDAADFEDEKTSPWATSPFPASDGRNRIPKEENKPLIEPDDTSILLFPGQGKQTNKNK